MNCPYLEKALRSELKLNGQRWKQLFKTMPDDQRLDYLSKLIVRRLLNDLKEQDFEAKRAMPEEEDNITLSSLPNVVGPLGSSTGGGQRVIRSSKPMT